LPKIWPVHYALGVAGIALIRSWMNGDETSEECARELRHLVDRFNQDPSLRFQLDIPDMDVESGYRLWADTYDDFHNPLNRCRLTDHSPIDRSVSTGLRAGRGVRDWSLWALHE
jgi:hypothetical protein